jgi:small multidrug resistance pump
MHLLHLAIAILAEVIGTSALKAADGFRVLPPTLVVIVAYGISFYFLSLALRTIPIGLAYAIWSGVGIVLISLAGWWLYRQSMDAAAFAGIALIVAGVLVINLFSKAMPH